MYQSIPGLRESRLDQQRRQADSLKNSVVAGWD